MIKVVIISPIPSSRGGVGKWIDIILKNKDKLQNVKIFNLTTYAYKAKYNKRSFIERFIMSFFNIFYLKKHLKKIIKTEKISIIHIAGTGGFSLVRDKILIKTAKKFNVKVVYHIHFGKLYEYYQSRSKRWKYNKTVIKMADAVLCLDPKTADICKNILKIKNTFLVPNPIDLKSLPHYNYCKENCISFLGWVIKTKGIEELLNAWKEIKNKYANLTLNIIGPIDEKYKTFLLNNFYTKDVVFWGRIAHSNAMEILSKSMFMVLPSHTEGFPNVILEAMALKTPVIATDVGAIKEILSDGCGIVIQPKDYIVLKHAMNKLIPDNNARDNIAQNAFNKVLAEYDAIKVLNRYAKIYNILESDNYGQ